MNKRIIFFFVLTAFCISMSNITKAQEDDDDIISVTRQIDIYNAIPLPAPKKQKRNEVKQRIPYEDLRGKIKDFCTQLSSKKRTQLKTIDCTKARKFTGDYYTDSLRIYFSIHLLSCYGNEHLSHIVILNVKEKWKIEYYYNSTSTFITLSADPSVEKNIIFARVERYLKSNLSVLPLVDLIKKRYSKTKIKTTNS